MEQLILFLVKLTDKMLQQNNYKYIFFYILYSPLFTLNNKYTVDSFYLFLHYYTILKKYYKPKKLNAHKLYWQFSWYLEFTKPRVTNLHFVTPTNVLITRFLRSKKFRYFFSNRPSSNFFFKLFKKQKKYKTSLLKRFFITSQRTILKKLTPFSITQRLFLSQRTITRHLWVFLYTSVKTKILVEPFLHKKKFNLKKKKKICFLNAHKPLIWKMRKARYAHWNLRTRGKLNEYRYDKLLGKELHFLYNVQITQFLSFILFITYYAILSWRQLMLVLTYNLIVYNGASTNFISLVKKGDIIELPFGKIHRSQIQVKRHFFKLLKKAKRLSYKNFLSHKKYFWFFRKHKNVPKIFKRLPVGLKFFGKLIAYDASLNTFAILYDLPKFQHHLNWKLSNSSVIGLQNWRYSFN